MRKITYFICLYYILVSASILAFDDENKERGKLSLSGEASSSVSEKKVVNEEPLSWRQITCFGLPGSGKTCTLIALTEVCKEVLPNIQSPLWINQDECGGNRRAFEEALRAAQKINTIVVADKGNHTRKHRQGLSALFGESPRQLKPLLIEFTCISDEELLGRIQQRGKGHRSLQDVDVAREVLAKWRKELNPIGKQDRTEYEVMSINPLDSIQNNLRLILNVYFQDHPELLRMIEERPDLLEKALEKARRHEEDLRHLDINPQEAKPGKHHRSPKQEFRGSYASASQSGSSHPKTKASENPLLRTSSQLSAPTLTKDKLFDQKSTKQASSSSGNQKKPRSKFLSSNPFGALVDSGDEEEGASVADDV